MAKKNSNLLQKNNPWNLNLILISIIFNKYFYIKETIFFYSYNFLMQLL